MHKVHADQCNCASQLKHKRLNPLPIKGVQGSHTAGIWTEMAELKQEFLADKVKPVGIKLLTDGPDFEEVLSATALSNGDDLYGFY